jgi:hypothetical protein
VVSTSPFFGLAQAHTPGESPTFAPAAIEGTGEIDSLADEGGFETSVPRERVNGFRDRPVRPLWHLFYKRRQSISIPLSGVKSANSWLVGNPLSVKVLPRILIAASIASDRQHFRAGSRRGAVSRASQVWILSRIGRRGQTISGGSKVETIDRDR